MKELKGTKTEANLREAFAGESQARNKYTFYASQAKKDGFVQIADIFEETARNEKEHAKIWFKLLEGGGIKDTLLCRLAADAVGARVLAGPAEATATGNAAVQFISLGELKDLWDARATIARSIDLKVYEPTDTAVWDAHYARYLQVTGL